MTEDPPTSRADHEPAFRAPGIAVLVALSMPALFFLQQRLHDQGFGLALFPRAVMDGQWTGLFTSMFLHADWTHAGMNAVGALAFGTPVARLMRGAGGAAFFLAFYMACGVLSALGYVLLNPAGADPVVGASGAVFGLIGASTRLMGRGRVLPLLDRRVLSMAAVWMGLNLVIGLIGLSAVGLGARIAWEAHAAGFLVGILAIGPIGRLFPPGIAPPSRLSDSHH